MSHHFNLNPFINDSTRIEEDPEPIYRLRPLTPSRQISPETLRAVTQSVKARDESPADAHGFIRSQSRRTESPVTAQPGIRHIQAVTAVWSRNHLIIAYILIWLLTFIDSLQQGTSGALTPYVTSAFSEHYMTAYTSVMSGVVGGVLKIPLAKVIDIFGRSQGFGFMTAFLIIGLIMMTSCRTVHIYAASQIFYWVGYNGMSYILTIFVADTSSLKTRGLMLAYTSSPYLITTWITGPLAQAFLRGPGWRWAFAILAILTFVAAAPLLFLLWWNYQKAVEKGLVVIERRQSTFCGKLRYYATEFDIGGLLLLTAALTFILLPFSLYHSQVHMWQSPLVISFLAVGGFLMIAFVLYETYVTPKTFIPYNLLSDPTILGACVLSCVSFVSYYIWNGYFFSFLQVVLDLQVTQATYIVNIYTLASCLWSLAVGAAILWSYRFKWIALYFGVPLNMLGVGFMIYFRQSENATIGRVIMSQLFIGFAGGALVITEQTAAMAAAGHEHVAVIIAVENMFSSIGGAIGSSIAAGMWTGLFPKFLAERLPEDQMVHLTEIGGSLVVQLKFPKGDPTRAAIDYAYGKAQFWMAIGATCTLLLTIPAVIVWRDIKVNNFTQSKNRVV